MITLKFHYHTQEDFQHGKFIEQQPRSVRTNCFNTVVEKCYQPTNFTLYPQFHCILFCTLCGACRRNRFLGLGHDLVLLLVVQLLKRKECFHIYIEANRLNVPSQLKGFIKELVIALTLTKKTMALYYYYQKSFVNVFS